MEREQKVAQANEQFEAARYRGETPRSTPRFLGILASQRPWKATGDGWTHEADFRAPFGGVQEEDELFEAKSSADRDSIRAAIGQLWDYKRLIGDGDLQLTVLVPEKPNDDLLDLFDYAGVGCM